MDALDDPVYEQRTADGASRYSQVIIARSLANELTPETLRRYDDAILREWDQVVARRAGSWGLPRMKYFQYLCLLAVEHVLNLSRENPQALIDDLNSQNAGIDYTGADLRKLAISLATGSGKTLLMHVNICQWLRIIGRDTVDGIVLITPSEMLSRQHVAELRKSGIEAHLFDSDAMTLFEDDALVSVIDINKLRETKGEKTVAVESFGSRNLVLIDEAHRGARSEDRVWKDNRDKLSRDGYAFEYSATFRQAIAASADAALLEEYRKAIVFDYPYRRFYNDGFGKDFRVRNSNFVTDSEEAHLYFIACLLCFFQQQVAFDTQPEAAHSSGIDAPLLLAVGTTVQKLTGARQASDVQLVLLHLRDFIEDSNNAISRIRTLLESPAALLTMDGHPLIYDDLKLLRNSYTSPESLYENMRRRMFNGGAAGGLRLTLCGGGSGEIHVSIESKPPFALINVGEAEGLFKHLVDNVGFSGIEAIGGSAEALFDSVSTSTSTISVLIGARKFLEGWDSHRPSAMLLMNVGKSEGTQIIQLFGRGVRLRGYFGSLKRSSQDTDRPPPPRSLRLLETLEIFGIRSDYMKRFRDVLEIEGIKSNFNTSKVIATDVTVPTSPELRILRSSGPTFVSAQTELRFDPTAPDIAVTVDWYPRVLSYGTLKKADETIKRSKVNLADAYFHFIDVNATYSQVLTLKRAHNWTNLVVQQTDIEQLIKRKDWYTLYCAEEALLPTDIQSIRVWQDIANALVCAFVAQWYGAKRREYEAKCLSISVLDKSDPAIVESYTVQYDGTNVAVEKLLNHEVEPGPDDSIELICLDGAIYQPMVYVSDRDSCTTVPTGLVKSERDFLRDLTSYVSPTTLGEGVSMYLLRNASRGRGMGFAEANNFYPDFLLWFCQKDKQVIVFVEPHGLVFETGGFASPKISFAKTVKSIEARLCDASLRLMASIISATPRSKVSWLSGVTNVEVEDYNLFFAEDTGYIASLIKKGRNLLAEQM